MRPEFEHFRTQLQGAIDRYAYRVDVRELGHVASIADGVAQIDGLKSVKLDEIVEIGADGINALVMDLQPNKIGAVLLDDRPTSVGQMVHSTGRVSAVPVGPSLLGRIVDPMGRPLDGLGLLSTNEMKATEDVVPALDARAPVTEPLMTGIAMVDAMFPIGRGQRQLILGDRGTGKTTIAVDAMINQRDTEVRCIYASIGQMASDAAAVADTLRRTGTMDRTTIVVASANDPPGVRFLAPYAACAIGEWFRDRGDDVLIVFDDLTAHAVAYRELSLLLRRPPGREAYPGDIFHIHSRLLERSTRLTAAFGGGSLTALPIVQTRAGRIADFIPTNIISITDGQLALDRALFERDIKPAIDIGTSVSRVGAKTQRASIRSVASRLRLDLARFLELEVFTQFGARLDDETKRLLNRGAVARELLKQPPGAPLSLGDQVARLVALDEGLFDGESPRDVRTRARRLVAAIRERRPDVLDDFAHGQPVTDAHRRVVREQS